MPDITPKSATTVINCVINVDGACHVAPQTAHRDNQPAEAGGVTEWSKLLRLVDRAVGDASLLVTGITGLTA